MSSFYFKKPLFGLKLILWVFSRHRQTWSALARRPRIAVSAQSPSFLLPLCLVFCSLTAHVPPPPLSPLHPHHSLHHTPSFSHDLCTQSGATLDYRSPKRLWKGKLIQHRKSPQTHPYLAFSLEGYVSKILYCYLEEFKRRAKYCHLRKMSTKTLKHGVSPRTGTGL